jgi:PAS domain S-box-containing protein
MARTTLDVPKRANMHEKPAHFTSLDEEDTMLRAILEGTAQETGARFFEALVQSLSKLLGTHGAWVTEYVEESGRLRAHAFWAGGNWVETTEYHLRGTPCETVIREGRFVHIPDDLAAKFPEDEDLRHMGAVSYAGVPLKDAEGKTIGNLAVIDTKPMPQEPRLFTIFRIFGARGAAELLRLRAEAEVLEREEKLRRLVDSAMDAVIELDAAFRVTSVNPAARSLFVCPEERMTGEEFARFLKPDAFLKLKTLAGELDRRAEGDQHLWVPGGFHARPAKGGAFQAEATLSRFEMRRKPFYALIVRNVNERFEAERTIRSLTVETEFLREEIRSLQHFDEIIGESEALKNVLRDVQQVAETDSTVLITGETGTGKELIARAIHGASQRRDKPFVKVNCPAIPATLIESEFFGHEKGAFTGATQKREGRFALADGGTLFLDEIAELPLDLQVKLLRVLQEGEFEPVGSSRTRKVDVRVIAATNRELGSATERGAFREDLYYRLNVFPIEIPPLRERGDDIVLLADGYVRKFGQALGRTVEPLSQSQIPRLKAYSWPGNVRELQNVIERAVITSKNGKLNLSRALPDEREPNPPPREKIPSPRRVDEVRTASELHELERNNFLLALERTGWKVAGEQGAARLLGIHPSTFASRMKSLGIKRPT